MWGGGDSFPKEERNQLSSARSTFWADGRPCADPVGLGAWGSCDLNLHSSTRKWILPHLQVRKAKPKMVKRLAREHIPFKGQSLDLNPGLWNSKPRCMPTCSGELAVAPVTLPESLQPVSGISLLQGRALRSAA